MNHFFLRACQIGILFTASSSLAIELPKNLVDAQNLSVSLLEKLINLDTAYPPGKEIEAARFLKQYFDKAGIKSTIYESEPGRASLVARLKGDGAQKPILLVSHLDVVPVERSHWQTDPFVAQIKDGRIYGRGSSDIKDLAVVQMLAMILIKESGVLLHRDIIYASVADEESHGAKGMKYLVDHHFSEIQAEFAFNEGSRGKPYLENGRVTWAALQVSERRSVNLKVVAHGVSGHSMLPGTNNPIFTLSKALDKLSQYEPPAFLNPALQRFVADYGKLKSLPKNWNETFKPGDSEDSKGLYAMMRTTINPTIINGGFRDNVVPTEAEANINCRIQPGIKTSEIISGIQKVIGDSRVTIEPVGTNVEDSPPISSMDSAATRAYESVIHKNFGSDVPFIPLIGAGSTDSRYLREKGINSYALEPMDDKDQHGHGNDESLSIDGLKSAVKIYNELLSELSH